MYGHYQSAGSSYAPPLGAAYGQAGVPAQAGYPSPYGQPYAGADRTSPPGVHAVPAGYPAPYGYPAQPASGQAGWTTDPYGRQVLAGAGQPLSEKEHERATKEWQKQLKQQQKEAEKSAKAAAKEAEKAAKVREKEIGKQQAAWERGQREREKAEEEEARRLERSSRGKDHQRGSSLSAVAASVGLSRSPSMAAQTPASTRERRVSNAMGFDKFGDQLANAMGGMTLEGRPLDPSTAEAVARRERRGSTAHRSPQPESRSRAYPAGAAAYGEGAAADPYAPTPTTDHERRVAAAQAEAYARAATNAQESYYGQAHADPAAVRAEEDRRRAYERLSGGAGADPYHRDPAAATRDAGREREREREREYDHQRRASSYNPGHGHTVASAAAAAAVATADPYGRSAYDYTGIAGASPGGGAGAAADPYHRSPYGAPPTDPYSRAAGAYGAPTAGASAYSPPRGVPPGTYPPPAGAPPTADPYARSPRAPAANDPYSRSPRAPAASDPYQRSPAAAAAAAAADPYQRSPGAAHADPYQRSPRYPQANVPPGSTAVTDAYRRSPYAMGDMPLAGAPDPYGATADPYRRSPGYGAHAAVPRARGASSTYDQEDAYGPSRTASESLRGRSAYDRSSAPAAPRGVDPRSADPYAAAGPVPRIGDPAYAYGSGRNSEQFPPAAGSHTHPASAYESLGGMQVPYPASAATAYHKYLTNPRDFANTEQLHELMSRDGRAAHAPAAPASPPGFHRTPNREQNYQYFEAFMIVDDLDGFYRETPHMPAALVSHDVFHEDWIRFMQDLAFAWSGRTPAPELGRDGRPPHNGVIVADLVDVWNSRFYHPRRVELIVYRGRTPVSARRFLDEYFDPRDNTVKWSLCLRCLDSPTMSGRR